MNHILPITYYFFGEFGYFHTIVINELDKYFKVSTNLQPIKLKTFDDYGVILKLLFGDKVDVSTIPLTNVRVCHEGKGNQVQTDKHIMELFPCKNIPLLDYKFDNNLSKKITWENSKVKKTYRDMHNIVCIFPRHRPLFQQGLDFESRNMTPIMYNKSVKLINDTIKNANIVIIGKKKEIMDHKYEYPIVDDIYEIIYLLNRCKLLVTTDSGFVDFAKNCGTANIVIGTYTTIVPYHYAYNPFKAKQFFLDYNKELSALSL